ncbi:MAG: insulinase family protein [Alphaproteobacteria bacterium]|nr:insulinase family protein [Alphaproteobacteria bacterium]
MLALASPRAAEARAFAAEGFRLANGLDVVVVTDRRAPVITQLLYYKVGAADEPAGKSGIAHFLEHLMFKGTEKSPAGAFSKEIARHGGRENAFTGHDYTGYWQTIARDRLDLIMGLEADRMLGLRLDPQVIAAERDVVLEERRQRTENDPASLLSEQMAAALFLHHPYRLPVIGWEHEIRGLGRDDAIAFYRLHYAPNNAVLVLAGDIDAAEARPLVEKHFGPLPRRDVAPRTRMEEPPSRAPRRVIFADARVKEPRWSRLYRVPAARHDLKRALALEVFVDALGGGATARLHAALVVERKIATGASAWLSASGLDHGRLGLGATPARGVDPAKIEEAIDETLAKAIADGITAEEVERAKAGLLAAAIYARDSASGTARLFGNAMVVGQTIDDVQAWPERIKALTVEEVNAAGRALIRLEASVTGLLLPKSDGKNPS